MGRRGLTSLIGICAALALLPASAGAAPGDIFVADTDYATPQGAIAKVPPTGGTPTLFADDAALFDEPWGLIMDRDRSLLVADYGSSKILRVSRTGEVTEFFSSAGQDGIVDFARGADGFLYVLDYVTLNIIKLNPRTLAFSEVVDNTGVTDWGNGYSIAVARDGTIYFTDGGDEVFKVKGGAVTDLYEGPLLSNADGLAISPDEKFIFVGDEGTNTIVRVNRATGDASALVSGYSDVTGITQIRDGGFLSGNGGDERIDRVPRSGSPITTFSSGTDYGYPHDIVVEPAACGGKLPTVVGTDRRDVIRGSRFADVISTLNGNDVVKGLGGKDILCGGKGRDKLIGGKGRDKLRGGPGRDLQRQ